MLKVKIREVRSNSDLKKFIKFQYAHYEGNTYWVPPLYRNEKNLLSKKNPSLAHCEVQLILAMADGKIVGRAAAIINRIENEHIQKKHARFGWLEFINNIEVSKALFGYLEDWARAREMDAIKGPFGFSNFDRAGLLIEGFDQIGTMATIYNHPYYHKHLDTLGYAKMVDWNEYLAPVPKASPERVIRLSKMLKDRYGLKDVPIHSKKDVKKLTNQFFPLVEAAYSQIDGFVPFSREQADVYTKKFLKFIHPDLATFVADKDGKLIGFGLAMPSFAKALQKANGRLFPFGIFPIRKAMKHNDMADLYLIGVLPEWQSKGVPAIIMNNIMDGLRKNNIKNAETNPQLENNNKLLQLFEKFEVHQHKKRRAFIKELYVVN